MTLNSLIAWLMLSCERNYRMEAASLTTFVTVSTIPAPPEMVWRHITTPEGINQELRPMLRMTIPWAFQGHTFQELQPGTRLGRSWLLLFGWLPVEYDELCIAEIEAGRRFLEISSMCSLRQWRHERMVLPQGSSCRVVDHIGFELRRPLLLVPGLNRAVAALLKAFFRHRHRRLAACFAETAH